jgi:hypothetical protein
MYGERTRLTKPVARRVQAAENRRTKGRSPMQIVKFLDIFEPPEAAKYPLRKGRCDEVQKD